MTALEVIRRCYGHGRPAAEAILANCKERGVDEKAIVAAYANGKDAVDAVIFPPDEVED